MRGVSFVRSLDPGFLRYDYPFAVQHFAEYHPAPCFLLASCLVYALVPSLVIKSSYLSSVSDQF